MKKNNEIIHPSEVHPRGAAVNKSVARSLPEAVEFASAPAPPSNFVLTHYAWILRRHWWKIMLFVGAAVAATFVVSSRLTPIYESTATVEIDRQMPAGIIGQEATRPGGNDVDQFLATQTKLIQSDSVLRPVALKYNLVETEARQAAASGEKHPAEDAPIMLRNLRVTRPPNTYLLSISYRSKDSTLASDVANAISQSYINHTYDIRFRSSSSLAGFMEKQLEELRAKMDRSSNSVAAFEKELNIISPEEKTSILSSRLVQLNTEYTNAEGDRVRKEVAYQAVKDGSLESAQTSTQGEALKKLSERLGEAQQALAETQTHFGPSHPQYKKAAALVDEIQRQIQKSRTSIAQRVQMDYAQAVAREKMLKDAVATTKVEFDRLNARSFEYQALKREAEADRKLYDELMRKIKEAGINANFQNSAIRMADQARPTFLPVYPNLKLNLSIAFLSSLLLSLIVVTVQDAMDSTLRDPDVVARSLDTMVIGTLPRIKGAKALAPPISGEKALVPASAGRLGGEWKGYEAAIRTLRNSILLTDFSHQLRSMMVTSPAPSEGKSTIAVNLAIANAQQGRKTLLIDCDLRRPSVHTQFGVSPQTGIKEVLHDEANWSDVVVSHRTVPKLDVLFADSPSEADADLIGDFLPRILEDAANYYELIIIDSPPVLGLPEPLQMATAVDGVLMVAHAGQTNRKALSSALGSLSRLRANVLGVVLNEVCPETTEAYAYYGNYYGKYYHKG